MDGFPISAVPFWPICLRVIVAGFFDGFVLTRTPANVVGKMVLASKRPVAMLAVILANARVHHTLVLVAIPFQVERFLADRTFVRPFARV